MQIWPALLVLRTLGARPRSEPAGEAGLLPGALLPGALLPSALLSNAGRSGAKVRRSNGRLHALYGNSSGNWCAKLLWLLLVFMTSGVSSPLDDLSAHIQAVECCDGACGESDGACCPRSSAGGCLDCTCCARGCSSHARAVLGAPLSMPALAVQNEPVGFARTRPRLPAGYRAPPFRPPLA